MILMKEGSYMTKIKKVWFVEHKTTKKVIRFKRKKDACAFIGYNFDYILCSKFERIR